jgi:FtsH-binding integral membrane protein
MQSTYDPKNPYANFGMAPIAAEAVTSERAGFIRRTYMHLAGGVFAFTLLTGLLVILTPPELVARVFSFRGASIFIMLGFMGVSWVANMWAQSERSSGLQYAGLGLYVVAEALFFTPAVMIASRLDPSIPIVAFAATLFIFGALTLGIFLTGADLAGWGRYLMIAGLAATAIVFASYFLGFSIGLVGTIAFIGLACAYILYDTSNVLHHYRTNQHVAASLALFSGFALLLWYVLRLLMSFSSDE